MPKCTFVPGFLTTTGENGAFNEGLTRKLTGSILRSHVGEELITGLHSLFGK